MGRPAILWLKDIIDLWMVLRLASATCETKRRENRCNAVLATAAQFKAADVVWNTYILKTSIFAADSCKKLRMSSINSASFCPQANVDTWGLPSCYSICGCHSNII